MRNLLTLILGNIAIGAAWTAAGYRAPHWLFLVSAIVLQVTYRSGTKEGT